MFCKFFRLKQGWIKHVFVSRLFPSKTRLDYARDFFATFSIKNKVELCTFFSRLFKHKVELRTFSALSFQGNIGDNKRFGNINSL